MNRFTAPALVVCVVAATAIASVQGVQTGTIRGVARDAQGLPMSDVAVTVTSAALQGARTATTVGDGAYVFRSLPPGEYELVFGRSGFAPEKVRAAVPLGGELEQNVTMAVGPRVESVDVVAEAPPVISSPVGGANFTQREVEALAVSRTLAGIAELSPGLTNITPNASQVSINGAFAFDNVFMLDGVDVNDNLFGAPPNLFVEDAIQEVQTLTSGISAEYGRFTGGVVNAISKSGGNTVAGSLRLNLTNPAWSTETPFERSRGVTRPDTLSKTTEGTIGGPLVPDRLWFFGAVRWEALTTPQTFPRTGIANSQIDKNRRGEIKVTGTVAPGHTLQGGYLNNHTENISRPSLPGLSVDPFTLATADVPNWFTFVNYRAALTPAILVDAQYSERRWQRIAGGTDRTVVESPFIALTVPAQFNAPYFDLADPEARNNRQLTGSLTSFFSAAGRHEVRGGYEWFRSQRTGGNSQTASDLVFHADYATDAAGLPIFDATQHLLPVFTPGVTFLESYLPQRNAVLNVDTQSLYAQDHWSINDRAAADLGVHFEHVKSTATGGIVGVDTSTVVPRLALSYDVTAAGSVVAHVTYGHYAGRYNEAQIAANSNVGNPDELIRLYVGPPGQGRNFAPGFSPSNYLTVAGNFPTANVRLASGLSSPITKEFTASLGTDVNGRGYGEITYVFRRAGNLIEDEIARQNGVTSVARNGDDFGTFTNIVFANSDIAKRQYQGLLLQSRYRIRGNWSLNGHFTLMLQNDGNYEGEAPNQPGLISIIGDYPEAFSEARAFPMGRLQDFQRHKLRVWSIYDLGFGRAGHATFSGLWRVNSGQVYNLKAVQPLSAAQSAAIAAYPDAPSSQTVFFAARGSETFKGYGVLDGAITYDVPVFSSLKPWVKFDVFNLLDNQKQIAWNTVVRANAAGPTDSLGLATGYVRSAAFGTADSNARFPAPPPGATGGRTFRAAIGFRF